MAAVRFVLQLVISLVVVALVMPGILFAVPEARGGRVGPALVAVIGAMIFLAVRLAWPRKRD